MCVSMQDYMCVSVQDYICVHVSFSLVKIREKNNSISRGQQTMGHRLDPSRCCLFF